MHNLHNRLVKEAFRNTFGGQSKVQTRRIPACQLGSGKKKQLPTDLAIHICWKVESEARMEPPIQTEYSVMVS
jgi:hypothetical protein